MSKEFITWKDRSARHEVKEFTKPVACPWCGGTDFWLAPWGWVCRKCHPPYEQVLKEWREKTNEEQKRDNNL